MVQVGSQKKTMCNFFLFPIFLIAKFWLIWLLDDHHLNYITKLKIKTLGYIKDSLKVEGNPQGCGRSSKTDLYVQ
jgi:hypothetical protein